MFTSDWQIQSIQEIRWLRFALEKMTIITRVSMNVACKLHLSLSNVDWTSMKWKPSLLDGHLGLLWFMRKLKDFHLWFTIFGIHFLSTSLDWELCKLNFVNDNDFSYISCDIYRISRYNSQNKAVWNVSRIQGNEALPIFQFYKQFMNK
jgi:hypothetical protein